MLYIVHRIERRFPGRSARIVATLALVLASTLAIGGIATAVTA
jgi:hypothetical protein